MTHLGQADGSRLISCRQLIWDALAYTAGSVDGVSLSSADILLLMLISLTIRIIMSELYGDVSVVYNMGLAVLHLTVLPIASGSRRLD